MHKDIVILNQGFKDLNPLVCGYESCTNGYSFGPASREYFLIHYIVSGKGIFKSKKYTYSLSEGNLFIIRPNEITYYKADLKEPWTYIWIGFECNLSDNLALQAEFLKKDVLYSKTSEPIFKGMLQAEKINYSKETFLCSKIFELFSLLIEAENQREIYNLPTSYVMKAQNYIETNYANSISVFEIANFLGIDRRYLCSIFKTHIGKSPQQYIVDLRLEKAAQLMLKFNYTPSEAAFSTGYKDIFNFSKMFKKKFKTSPRNFKKQNF